MSKLITVIHTEVKRGKGVEEDPTRMVTQYFRIDGELLAEVDEWEKSREDLQRVLAATQSNCKYWEGCFMAEVEKVDGLEKEIAELKQAIIQKAKKGPKP